MSDLTWTLANLFRDKFGSPEILAKALSILVELTRTKNPLIKSEYWFFFAWPQPFNNMKLFFRIL